MGTYNLAVSGADILLRDRPFLARNLLDHLASLLWPDGVPSEAFHGQDPKSTCLGKTDVGSYSSELADDKRNDSAWLSLRVRGIDG